MSANAWRATSSAASSFRLVPARRSPARPIRSTPTATTTVFRTARTTSGRRSHRSAGSARTRTSTAASTAARRTRRCATPTATRSETGASLRLRTARPTTSTRCSATERARSVRTSRFPTSRPTSWTRIRSPPRTRSTPTRTTTRCRTAGTPPGRLEPPPCLDGEDVTLNGRVDAGETNPNDEDSDLGEPDGLLDGREVQISQAFLGETLANGAPLLPSVNRTPEFITANLVVAAPDAAQCTLPLDPDSDDDGLLDGAEVVHVRHRPARHRHGRRRALGQRRGPHVRHEPARPGYRRRSAHATAPRSSPTAPTRSTPTPTTTLLGDGAEVLTARHRPARSRQRRRRAHRRRARSRRDGTDPLDARQRRRSCSPTARRCSRIGTDPHDSDTDDDGLSDGAEVVTLPAPTRNDARQPTTTG